MLKKTIDTLRKAVSNNITHKHSQSILAQPTSYCFTTKYTRGYHPPESQLTHFTQLMSNIENKESMEEAAQKMAQMQAD